MMGLRKFCQYHFPTTRQPHMNLAVIAARVFANHELVPHQAVNQFHRTVMPNLEALRQFSHEDAVAPWISLDGKQGLVLLRCNARSYRRLFAKMQKLAKSISK